MSILMAQHKKTFHARKQLSTLFQAIRTLNKVQYELVT